MRAASTANAARRREPAFRDGVAVMMLVLLGGIGCIDDNRCVRERARRMCARPRTHRMKKGGFFSGGPIRRTRWPSSGAWLHTLDASTTIAQLNPRGLGRAPVTLYSALHRGLFKQLRHGARETQVLPIACVNGYEPRFTSRMTV